MKRVYLDYAAATPLSPASAVAYTRALKLFGNASAAHAEGRAAKDALTGARIQIARTLAVKPDELVFTSGGTEANNIAIMGTEWQHAVTSTIEHSSVLQAFALMEERGRTVTYVAPQADGIVRTADILAALTPETGLVSLHHVNSESGVIQPVAELGLELRKRKNIVFHVDAAQSPLWLDAGPHTLRADLVSYDAQKVMGPKGVGLLYRDFSVPLTAVTGGGSQERGIRPGTENVPAAVGAATAFVDAAKGRKARAAKVATLRDYLAASLQKHIPEIVILGSMKRRVPNNLFITIPGADGDYLAVVMDKAGVAVSPRSACVGTGAGHSHVALALTGDMARAKGTLRFTLGPATTKADLALAVKALVKSVRIATSG